MQVAMRDNVHINQTVPGYLIQHMIQKRQAGGKRGRAVTVEINGNVDLGFERIALNLGGAWVHA